MAAKKKPAEAGTFDAFMDHLLSVPKAEIVRREAEYQKQAAQKPKRGPKPKAR